MSTLFCKLSYAFLLTIAARCYIMVAERAVLSLHERIDALIKALGLNQTKFAERINVSRSYVSQMCIGNKIPADRTISDICREFDVNETWLRTGEGEMFIEKSREEEIAAFVGNILKGEPDFRRRLVSVLARLSVEEWQMLEQMAKQLNEE